MLKIIVNKIIDYFCRLKQIGWKAIICISINDNNEKNT